MLFKGEKNRDPFILLSEDFYEKLLNCVHFIQYANIVGVDTHNTILGCKYTVLYGKPFTGYTLV